MQLKEISKKLHGAAADSVILTFVKIITAVLGLLTTKLLSTRFSLQDYGTYSQAMLIVSTVSSISILGLTDATNFFYNAADDDKTKRHNISTVFGLQYIVGIFCGVLISVLHSPIYHYFSNDKLKQIIFFAAWYPVFQNLIPMLQVLFVSIGKARVIAVRNFVVSVARLMIVAAACFITNSIIMVFVLVLALDIAQFLYFYISFSKSRFRIRLRDFRVNLIKPILGFSIPMAVFVFTNALSRDIDKYVISYFTDTQTLAIYTNAAKILPFDMLTASFLTVLIPIVTRQVRSCNYVKAQKTFKAYLRIGYLVTWILVAGAIVTSREMMIFFYDEKYLPGLGVFIVYLVVDMMRFANTSLVLSAKGKTKTLMKWSIISLAVNLLLNILAFKLVGLIGPAITTLIITVLMMIIYLRVSAQEIETRFMALFDWKEIFTELCQLAIVGGVAYGVKTLLTSVISSNTIILIIIYGMFVGFMALIKRNKIMDCLRTINRLK